MGFIRFVATFFTSFFSLAWISELVPLNHTLVVSCVLCCCNSTLSRHFSLWPAWKVDFNDIVHILVWDYYQLSGNVKLISSRLLVSFRFWLWGGVRLCCLCAVMFYSLIVLFVVCLKQSAIFYFFFWSLLYIRNIYMTVRGTAVPHSARFVYFLSVTTWCTYFDLAHINYWKADIIYKWE